MPCAFARCPEYAAVRTADRDENCRSEQRSYVQPLLMISPPNRRFGRHGVAFISSQVLEHTVRMALTTSAGCGLDSTCHNQGLERAMGGVWTRLKLACAAFFTILFKGRLPAALQTPRAGRAGRRAARRRRTPRRRDSDAGAPAARRTPGRFPDSKISPPTATRRSAPPCATCTPAAAGARPLRHARTDPVRAAKARTTVPADRVDPAPSAWSAT